jgi:carbon-monoxide dehydrogenase large subunit
VQIRSRLRLPPEVPQSVDFPVIADGLPPAFPNGCRIAESRVCPDTGVVEVVRYSFVSDFAVVINPLLVNGQAHGRVQANYDQVG